MPSKKEFSPQLTWILFEEPEAFLHPSQVEALERDLRAFSAADGQQVLLCSHSPIFASQSMEDLPAIIRLSRENAQTKVGQLNRHGLPALLEANQDCLSQLKAAGVPVSDDDEVLEMETIKYVIHLNPLRASIFFAQRVLLVEGPTEDALLRFLLNRGYLMAPDGGLVVVDTLGKWNTYRFMHVLGALRIPHSVLFDRDGEKPKDIVFERVIRAAANEHTLAIEAFDMDLEDFLNVKKCKETHRKPQHLLWQFYQGNVTDDRRDALCAKLQPLLAVNWPSLLPEEAPSSNADPPPVNS